MSSENERYKSYISWLGNCCGFCCCTYKRIQTSSMGLIQSFGKYKEMLDPGLHYYNPFTEEIKEVSIQTRVVQMHNQVVYTKDNISVEIDTALFFRIIDPYKATYIVKDLIRSLMEMTFVTMRTVAGQYVLQDLLIKRTEINDKIADHVTKNTEHWGVLVQHLILKDMKLSGQLSQNLSVVSRTKRSVEAQIISAKADLESAKLYREASDILDMKAAVQIRFLETLENMNSFQSQKITIVPLKPEYDFE